MIKAFHFLTFIPQRLLGVWLFLMMFEHVGQIEFGTKDLLLNAAQSLTIVGISYFSIPKAKIEELLSNYGLNYYSWFVATGLFTDFIFVTVKVLFW